MHSHLKLFGRMAGAPSVAFPGAYTRTSNLLPLTSTTTGWPAASADLLLAASGRFAAIARGEPLTKD